MSMDMTPDSVEAKFWMGQHGDAPLRESHMDSAKEDAEASYNEARGRAEDEVEWNASRGMREELLSKYSDVKTGDLLGNFAQWDAAFRRDPVTAADHFARSYASRGPVVGKARETHDDTPPADLDEIGKRNWHRDNDVRKALHDAAFNASDRSEFAATAKERALIKQAFPDRKFSEVMTSLAAIDDAMQSAPHHVAQKLAVMYGAPATQGQAVERHYAAEQERQAAGLSQWVEQVEQTGAMPYLTEPTVQAAVVNVLEHMNATGQRSDSVEHDLAVAYNYAVTSVRNELQAGRDRDAADRARNASRSLSNSPTSDIYEGDEEPRTAHDAARAAYRSIAA